MASNKRTIFLGLDYSQFTGGVAEVNRKMGLLDAEFKLAQERAKNYGEETDSLGLKQDYLSQKIALQIQKVEAAKAAYDKAMSSQNASQKEIDALDKKLLQERTTLEKLNGQLKEADENIKNADKSTRSFGDEIRGVASALGINVSPAIEKLAKQFDGLDASVGNAMLAIGAIGTAFVKSAVDAAEYSDTILTLADQTGIATDELQKLEYASNFVDVGLDTMASSMSKLTKTMSNARDGSKESAEAFKKLHIRITDGNGALRDSTTVFYETIDALGKIKNETERDAMAMKIFGRSAQELNPLIKKGSESLKELGDRAEATGKVLSPEELLAGGQLQDALDDLDETIEKFKLNLGMEIIPLLTNLINAIASIPVPVLKTIAVIASVVASIVLVVKAIKSVTSTASAITGFFKTFDLAANRTTLIIVGVIAALVLLIRLITVLVGKGKEAENAMKDTGEAMANITGAITGAQNNLKQTAAHATGTANFAGGKTWVGEAGPELVTLPEGSSITPEKEVGQTVINNYYCTIDAKNVRDFNQVVEIMNAQRMAERRLAY